VLEVTENIPGENSLSQFHWSPGIDEKLRLKPTCKIFGVAENCREPEELWFEGRDEDFR
jgi:hypothetical protein